MLKTLLVVGSLAALPLAGLAQGNGPGIFLYNDGLGPPPITAGIGTIEPGCTSPYAIPGGTSTDPTCTYYFRNNTGSILDGFTFETNLTGVTLSQPAGNFSYGCADLSAIYNFGCTPNFNTSTDELSFVFSAASPGAGIPAVGPNSTFYFVLEGWSASSRFSNVTLANSFSVSVPEASSVLILLTELLLLAGLTRLLGLRWNRSWRGIVQPDR